MYATLFVDSKTHDLICVCHGVPPQTTVSYQLMRHSSSIGEAVLTTATTHRWDAHTLAREGGDYHVVVTVGQPDKPIVLTTEWQFVPSDRLRKIYRDWLDEDAHVSDPLSLELRPMNRPYESIAVVQFLSSSDGAATVDVADICADTNAQIIRLEGKRNASEKAAEVDPAAVPARGTYIITSAKPAAMEPNDVAYGSGFAFHNDTLRRGSDTAQTLTTVSPALSSGEASEPRYSSLCGGTFLATVIREDSYIEFHSDYFGAAQWYEYQSDRLRVVASSYLLTALIALACGERFSMNLPVIDADFTSLTQGFQQPVTDDLPLNGFVCLRSDTVVVLGVAGGRWARRSQLGHDLMFSEKFTVDRFNELFDEASTELVANCAALLKDPSIREVRCDISGGLDSRLVLAAFLASPENDISKLSLYTSGSSPTVGDEKIAVMISEVTGVKFSESPTASIGPCSARHRASRHVASEFGTYWHSTHSPLKEWDPTTAYVSGSAMDNLVRDYSTPTWRIFASPATEPCEVSMNLARQLFRWRGRATIKPAPSIGLSSIARSWDNFPGDELDKGSQVFNFYRARYHGGGTIPATNGVWRVAPGPSRPFHLLRLMAGRVMPGPGIQIRMIHAMSPALAAVPYSKAVNNQTHAALYGGVRTDLEADPEQLIRSRKRKTAAHQWKPCPECNEADEGPASTGDTLAEMTLSALRDLARDPELSELMLAPFRFARLHFPSEFGENHSYGKTFANKLLHLHGMWRLAQQSSARPMGGTTAG